MKAWHGPKQFRTLVVACLNAKLVHGMIVVAMLRGAPALALESLPSENFEHITAREWQNFERAQRARVLQKAAFGDALSSTQQDADPPSNAHLVTGSERWDLSGFFPLPASFFGPVSEGSPCLKIEFCKDL